MKHSSVCMAAVALLSVSSVSTVFGASEANLIQNGDFENALTNGWESGSYAPSANIALTEEKAQSGRKSLCLRATTEPNDVWVTQKVAVKPSTFYQYTAQVAAENVTEGKVGATIGIMGTWNYAGNIAGTRGWTPCTMNFRTYSTQKDVLLHVRLGYWGNTVTGKAWFDNVDLVELKQAPADFVSISPPEGSSGSQSSPASTNAKAESGTSARAWVPAHPMETAIIASLLIIFLVAFLASRKDAAERRANKAKAESDAHESASEPPSAGDSGAAAEPPKSPTGQG